MIKLFKQALSDFIRDDAIMMSAALAFYTALSLAPLLIILITVAGYLLGDTRDLILEQAALLAGPRARTVVAIILDNAGERRFTGSLSAVLSGLIVLFSATAVFAHLRKSMNRIWKVEYGRGWNLRGIIRSRILSLGMVALICGALFVSFFVTTAMQRAVTDDHPLWEFIARIGSFIVFVLFFALIFKFLPDVVVHWRDVFAGALGTALLFEIGKLGIGLYLRTSGAGSVYGAAGSLIVFLIWIYYSSVIFFFGIELTHTYTSMYGAGVVAVSHARLSSDDPGGTGVHLYPRTGPWNSSLRVIGRTLICAASSPRPAHHRSHRTPIIIPLKYRRDGLLRPPCRPIHPPRPNRPNRIPPSPPARDGKSGP